MDIFFMLALQRCLHRSPVVDDDVDVRLWQGNRFFRAEKSRVAKLLHRLGESANTRMEVLSMPTST